VHSFILGYARFVFVSFIINPVFQLSSRAIEFFILLLEINIEKCVTDSVEAYCSTPKSVLCRKHEPPASEGKSIVLKNLGSENANFSNYDSGSDIPLNEALVRVFSGEITWLQQKWINLSECLYFYFLENGPNQFSGVEKGEMPTHQWRRSPTTSEPKGISVQETFINCH